MNVDLYVAFLLLSALLIVTPGLNVMLIVANSLCHGRRAGLLTVAGTSSAMVLQLGITILGVMSLLLVLGDWLNGLKWAGAGYLVYLGVRRLMMVDRSNPRQPQGQPYASRSAFWQGFLVSLSNPKTLAFFAAYLPQFVDPGQPSFPQLVVLAVSFVLMALVFDSLYAILAARFQRRNRVGNAQRVDRFSGWLLIAAGVVLGMTGTKIRSG